SCTVSPVAMLPVTTRTIVVPWGLRVLALRRRFGGCIVVKRRLARYVGMVPGPTYGSDSNRPAVGVGVREGLSAIMTSLGTETPCAAVLGTASAGAASDDGGAATNGPRDFWPHRHAAGGCGDRHPRVRRAVVPSCRIPHPAPRRCSAERLHEPDPDLGLDRRCLDGPRGLPHRDARLGRRRGAVGRARRIPSGHLHLRHGLPGDLDHRRISVPNLRPISLRRFAESTFNPLRQLAPPLPWTTRPRSSICTASSGSGSSSAWRTSGGCCRSSAIPIAA